jgi:hypothetical protein
MAITINTQPSSNELKSPYRPLQVKVSSNAGTIAKMKCFIHLDGGGTADNASNPIILDPDFGTTDEFTFDISGYLAGLDTLTATQQVKSDVVSLNDTSTNSLKSVYVKFTELLDNGTTLSDGASSSNSNTFYVINGVWQYDEVSTEFTDFNLANTGSRYFLTNNRSTREISLNDSYYLSFWTTRSTTDYFRVRRFTGKNGTGSNSDRYRPFSLTKNRWDVACGPTNINSTFGGWFSDLGVTSASDPTLNDTYGSYEIQLFNNTSGAISEAVLFNLDHSGCEDNWTRIKFLNRLGAFEYFTFKGYRDKSVNIRKNYYNRVLSESYSIGEGGDRTMYTDSRTQFVVYSQQLKQADREWLIEMLEGNECFVEEGSNYIPIKVRAGGTELINEGDGLMTIKMTYEYANPNRRQHGGY